MKMKTRMSLGQVYLELIVIIFAMMCVSLLLWGSLFFGKWAFAAAYSISSLSVVALIVFAQYRGHEFFFEPLLRRRPMLMAPIILGTSICLFMAVAYGAARVLDVLEL